MKDERRGQLGRGLIVAGAALALAAPAHANAGTAMMWLIPGHLLIGNLIIGLVEWGVLMALLGGQRHVTAGSIFTVIAGNYLSAWGGVLLLPTVWREIIARQFAEPLYQMGQVIGVSWLSLFAFSVLIEWFFVRRSIGQMTVQPWGWLRSLGATIIVNVASYAALTGLYFLVCPVSLATQTQLDPSLTVAHGVAARVLYVADDGKVWSVRPDGSERKQLGDARTVTAQYPRLSLKLNPETSLLDLYGGSDAQPVARGVGRTPVFADAGLPEHGGPNRPEFGANSHGWRAADLRAVGDAGTYVGLGTWAYEGIFWRRNRGDRQNLLHLALETPFLALTPSSGTLVGKDLLIYQYQDAFHGTYHRVVVLDLRTRTLGVLANGRSPVVVLDELPAGAMWWKPGMPGPEQRKSKY